MFLQDIVEGKNGESLKFKLIIWTGTGALENAKNSS